MHDKEGHVTLPGFYDKVRPLPEEEREALSKVPTTDDEWRRLAGAPALFGEKGYTATERAGARPALDVNGLYGGFMGKGSKTVLPARATAKLSMRLVPDQDEAEVYDQLCTYVQDRAPDTVTWQVRELSRGCGSVMDRHSCYMKCAVAALQEVFGAEPIFRREGGSIPLVGMMQRKLNVDTIMLGFGLPDDNIHGPNERQHLPTLFRGMEAYIRFLQKL